MNKKRTLLNLLLIAGTTTTILGGAYILSNIQTTENRYHIESDNPTTHTTYTLDILGEKYKF